MTFTFGQSDVIVTMTPEKPRPGLKPMVRKAYSRYGRLKERTVQEMCDAIGGHCVYVEFEKGGVRHVMPIPSWRRAADMGVGGSGRLIYIAHAMQEAALYGVKMVAFGSDRVRWTVYLTNVRQSARGDVMDAEPDSSGTPARPAVSAGGMREEF